MIFKNSNGCEELGFYQNSVFTANFLGVSGGFPVIIVHFCVISLSKRSYIWLIVLINTNKNSWYNLTRLNLFNLLTKDLGPLHQTGRDRKL